MLKKDPNYTRLKKLGGRGNTGSAYYWLGPDHLLVVEVATYNERYRRFYFRDIQAVVVQRNRYRMWVNILTGVISILPVIGAFALISDGEYAGAFVVSGILFLFGLIIAVNSLRGPTCSVHLRTAVQTQKLSNISRWPKAELLFEILTPLIQSAQTAAVETSAVASNFVTNPPADSIIQPGTP